MQLKLEKIISLSAYLRFLSFLNVYFPGLESKIINLHIFSNNSGICTTYFKDRKNRRVTSNLKSFPPLPFLVLRTTSNRLLGGGGRGERVQPWRKWQGETTTLSPISLVIKVEASILNLIFKLEAVRYFKRIIAQVLKWVLVLLRKRSLAEKQQYQPHGIFHWLRLNRKCNHQSVREEKHVLYWWHSQ